MARITHADMAALKAANATGLRRFARGWAARYDKTAFCPHHIEALRRKGLLDNEPDEIGPRVVLTRDGRRALERIEERQHAASDFEQAVRDCLRSDPQFLL